MKITMPLLLGAALICAAAVPATSYAQSSQSSYAQSDQDRDLNRNTEAYRDGYSRGQTDAQGGARNDQPSDRWTKDDDQRAFRQGYDAGYQNGRSAAIGSTGAASDRPLSNDAARYGYDDGLAAGRHDKTKGERFRPTDSEMYKHADHGWAADFGDKAHYKQVYRQAYAKGYEQGYNGGAPR